MGIGLIFGSLLAGSATAGPGFRISEIAPDTGPDRLSITFCTTPETRYIIEFREGPGSSPWQSFANVDDGTGTWFESGVTPSSYVFVDDLSAATSGSTPLNNARNYRVRVPQCAVFSNPEYVDVGPTSNSEASNLKAVMEELGYAVNDFTGVTAGAISSAIEPADILVFPELENQELLPSLDGSARAAISNFVSNGGAMIVCGEFNGREVDLVNGLFGHAILSGFEGTVVIPSQQTAAATGTFFQNNAQQLTHNEATFAWRTSTLPGGGNQSMYQFHQGGMDHTTVANIPQGNGRVIFLAWDWFGSEPAGTANNGWIDILESGMLECLRP